MTEDKENKESTLRVGNQRHKTKKKFTGSYAKIKPHYRFSIHSGHKIRSITNCCMPKLILFSVSNLIFDGQFYKNNDTSLPPLYALTSEYAQYLSIVRNLDF